MRSAHFGVQTSSNSDPDDFVYRSADAETLAPTVDFLSPKDYHYLLYGLSDLIEANDTLLKFEDVPQVCIWPGLPIFLKCALTLTHQGLSQSQAEEIDTHHKSTRCLIYNLEWPVRPHAQSPACNTQGPSDSISGPPSCAGCRSSCNLCAELRKQSHCCSCCPQ